jgi:ribose transport system substrate-binding protein
MKVFKRSRVTVAAVIALGLTLSVAGCSSSGSSGSGGSGKSAGIVEFDSTSPIDSVFAAGTKSSLQGAGFDVFSQDPKGDSGQANTICSQYVTRQVTALVVITFSLDQMAQCMSQAKAANIPVFFTGSPLLDGMAGAVDVTAPAPINDLFIDYLKSENITSVLTLDYSPGTPCKVRSDYRDKAIASSGLKVDVSKHEFPIPGQVVDAQSATAAWLAAHPAGSGKLAIWSCFADPTSGAVAALNQAERKDVAIFTWDFNKTILAPIQSGQIAADLYLDAPKVGEQVTTLVTGFLKDKKADGVVGSNTILNKDNVDQFVKDNPDTVK